jgi:DNA adenine methylase
VNSDPASTESVEVVVSYRDTPSILIVDLGVFGKIAVTMKEWIQLIEALPRIKDPSQRALLSLPGRLREICLKMRLAGAVKYDAKNLHWKIDSRELKIYRFLPHAPTTPAKTTRLPPATPVKPAEEKAETPPSASDMLAKEILEHVVEKHGVGKPTKPFRYVGGDWFIKDELLDLLAKSKCKTLVEVFGGSGIVSMYAPRDVFKNIVYNDKDSLLTNFFMVLKDRADELVKKLALIPLSKEIFEKYTKMIETGEIHKLDPVEKAVATFYTLRASMWGMGDSFAVEVSRSTAVEVKRQIALLPEYAKMWADVTIENRDFRDIIKIYDREYTVFYCDPPHLSVGDVKREHYYRLGFTEKDMKDLLDMLSSIKGKFVLKLPEDHLEIKFIKKWIEENKYNVREVEIKHTMLKVIGEKRPKFTIILIHNYKA